MSGPLLNEGNQVGLARLITQITSRYIVSLVGENHDTQRPHAHHRRLPRPNRLVKQLTFLPGHLLIAWVKVASETAHMTPERFLTGERVGEGYFQTLRNRD